MSTRARIGILLSDGTVKSINCYQDGYPEFTGKRLAKYYTSEKEVLELINGGDIMSLGKTSYDSDPDPAGGETQVFKSLGHFTTATTNSGLDYLYIFSSQVGWQYLAINE